MLTVDIEPNDEEKLEKLSQDYDKPFSPPIDIKDFIPKDYPSLDTGIDAHEWYDEGGAGAAESIFPKQKIVMNYHRPIVSYRY